ncbi:MAG: tRNA (adenosine(37)-N6)-dimethylallyltransferase MiaA [bacterium]|nr:tRNA (adenosine(37)-N6)-dimethylallyltransferase MiaA [Patescibacteria group bacterium]MDW8279827.1 tRNA (adenosine(37)-N6)-dimethylallyltransferase MiaA [bacterium]
MENDAKPKIIVIVGPTASGKTALAIQLAKKFNGEIISADSRQIYRGMDIGTAKATKKEQKIIKHYLIDIKNPNQNYTVANFKKDAFLAINKILKNKKLPFLVGGTGLYVQAVVDNLDIPKVKPNKKLRLKLEKELNKYGKKYLFNKLVLLDPEAQYIVDPNNPRRIIRALEICILTGKPFSSQRKKKDRAFNVLKLGINLPKSLLYEKIDKRVDLMIKKGLIKEVKRLIEEYGKNHQSFDAIGYREIIDYLDKKISKNEAITQIKHNTKLFAKRQLTWFKKDKEINWVDNSIEAEKLVNIFLKK